MSFYILCGIIFSFTIYEEIPYFGAVLDLCAPEIQAVF